MGRHRWGLWLLSAGGLVGLAVVLYYYLTPHNGIDGTEGALLVVVSSALILIAGLARLIFRRMPRALRVILDILLFFGIIGTGFAAYMLEAYPLLAAMVVSFIGWLINPFRHHEAEHAAVRVPTGAAS